MIKRCIDVGVGSVALLLLAPVLLGIALWIRIDSPGAALFRQQRVGRHGTVFRIHKFRTMRARTTLDSPDALGDESRVTRVGRVLRRWKVDELPQLMDVLAGTMSLVGPRPELPRYVAWWSEEDRRVILSVRPGMTDPASIRFVHESELLRHSPDPEQTYLTCIVPEKVRLYREYVLRQSLGLDLRLLAQTGAALLARSGRTTKVQWLDQPTGVTIFASGRGYGTSDPNNNCG